MAAQGTALQNHNNELVKCAYGHDQPPSPGQPVARLGGAVSVRERGWGLSSCLLPGAVALLALVVRWKTTAATPSPG